MLTKITYRCLDRYTLSDHFLSPWRKSLRGCSSKTGVDFMHGTGHILKSIGKCGFFLRADDRAFEVLKDRFEACGPLELDLRVLPNLLQKASFEKYWWRSFAIVGRSRI
jgi:hypothetical protein